MPDVQSSIRPPHERPAADSKRPRGAHLFEVFSPKAKRRLTLFGVAAVKCWLKLEADPGITALCERPLVLPDKKRHQTVDFWANGPSANKYVIVVNADCAARVAEGETLFPAFCTWAQDVGCEIEYVSSAVLADETTLWYDNWTDVLQHLSRYRNYVQGEIRARVEGFCTCRRTLASIYDHCGAKDFELSCATVFLLAHEGRLKFVDLTSHRLSDQTEVEPR
jgi:hypothetical protein